VVTADRRILARCVLEQYTYPTGLITLSDDISENLPAMLYLAGYTVQNYVPAPGRFRGRDGRFRAPDKLKFIGKIDNAPEMK
jgi:hypothetical protein